MTALSFASTCNAAAWPDWSGEAALIVATGTSAAGEPLDAFKGRCRCIVIKSSWRLAPWADVLYGLDRGWWLANNGCPEFKGLKVSPSPTACRIYGLREVRLKTRAEVLTKEMGVLGCGLKTGGGHSGFQAINLAVQFGAKRLLLVGFDMHINGRAHWHQDYRGVAKPDQGRIETWREALDECAQQFTALGVEIINCSRDSALRAYPKRTLQEAMQ